MGLGPVFFPPKVSTVSREMLWREALAGHLVCSLTFGSLLTQWVFTLGTSASKLEEGWDVGIGRGEPRSYSEGREGMALCGFC